MAGCDLLGRSATAARRCTPASRRSGRTRPPSAGSRRAGRLPYPPARGRQDRARRTRARPQFGMGISGRAALPPSRGKACPGQARRGRLLLDLLQAPASRRSWRYSPLAEESRLPQLAAEDALARILPSQLGKDSSAACSGLGRRRWPGSRTKRWPRWRRRSKVATAGHRRLGFERAGDGGRRPDRGFRADTLESRLAPGVFADADEGCWIIDGDFAAGTTCSGRDEGRLCGR